MASELILPTIRRGRRAVSLQLIGRWLYLLSRKIDYVEVGKRQFRLLSFPIVDGYIRDRTLRVISFNSLFQSLGEINCVSATDKMPVPQRVNRDLL